MTTTTNFKSIPLLRQWCMLTLPTVFNDALSYEEQVCKLTHAINEMATTINGLPDYIIALVKELLDQMNLEEIVKQVLADYFFINVKNPPAPLVAAKGDGIANDTAAIQSMINYVSGKKNYLFFPAGIYSVNQLTMVPNVSLVGQDRFQAIINLEAGSNTDLITGEMGNCTISNLTLSANMPGQTQNCSVYHGNVTSMLFDNVIFKNGFDVLSLDIDGLVQMSSIVVDGAQGNGVMIGGSRCSVDVIDFMNTSALNNETLLTVSGANHVIQNVTCYTAIKNGLVINGNNNVVKGVILNAITPVTNSGTNNRIEIVTTNNNIEIQNGTAKTISGPYEVSASSSTEKIAGDKDVIANNVEISATGNMNVHGNDTSIEGTNTTISSTAKIALNGADVVINPTNPVTYKQPANLNNYFDSVKFKTAANTEYDVLVWGDKFIDAITLVGLAINLDTYDGTDSQKLMAAINANPNGALIVINRNLTLTEDVSVSLMTQNRPDKRITFMGAGGITIDMGAFSFKGGIQYSGNVTFQNIIFTGTGNAFICNDYLIRLRFLNCAFNGFQNVFYSPKALMQEVECFGCYFTFISNSVINVLAGGTASYFENCHCVYGKSFLTQTGTAGMVNFTIRSTVIEQMTGTGISFTQAVGLLIDSCYLEANPISIDMSNGIKDSRSVTITNNWFLNSGNNKHIVLGSGAVNSYPGFAYIANNNTGDNIALIDYSGTGKLQMIVENNYGTIYNPSTAPRYVFDGRIKVASNEYQVTLTANTLSTAYDFSTARPEMTAHSVMGYTVEGASYAFGANIQVLYSGRNFKLLSNIDVTGALTVHCFYV